MEWQRRQILSGAGRHRLGGSGGEEADVRADRKDGGHGRQAGRVNLAAAAGNECNAWLLELRHCQGCADDDGIWVTEVWGDKASHDASLSLPVVQKTIAAARPMIAGFSNPVVTTPVGGHGLPGAKPAI